MTFNVGLDASFHDMYDLEGTREKAGEGNGTKPYVTNDEASR
jgi:hypothetical protein